MTVAVGMELGAGTGLGADPGAGATAGIGVGTGSGTSFGRAFAAFENAGTSAGLSASAALAAGKGTSEDPPNAPAWNEASRAGLESFNANWQSMLRACGGPAHASGETLEETAGESSEPDTANGSGDDPDAGGLGMAFAGREAAQSQLVSRGNGSTANGVVPGSNAPRANQLTANGSTVAAGTESAAAWSATKTTSSIGSSVAGSKIEKRQSISRNAGVEGQAVQKENGMAGSPVDVAGFASQLAPMPMPASIPHASGIHAAAAGQVDVRIDDTQIDDQTDSRAARNEQPTPGPSVAINEREGAVATAPVPAVANSDVSARTAGQIPTRASQTPPANRAMNGGAGAAVKVPDGEQDDEQEGTIALPQSTLTAAAMATASAPKAVSVIEMGTTSGAGETKTTISGLGAHRGPGERDGTSTAQATTLIGADKPGAETGIESPRTPLGKTAHDAAGERANAANSQQDGAHVVVAQNPGIDSPAMVRDPAGAHGAANTPATIRSSSGGPATAPQETFAALDAGTTVGAPNWVHAGGSQAEAGFEDPALGWVGVRADLSGGSVHATLVPGSTDAAQALSGHLEGLSAYLSEQHSPVATLTMAAPGNGGTGLAFDQNLGQSMGQGMEQNAGQHGQQNQAPAIETESQPGIGSSSSATSSAVPASQFEAMAYARDGRGTHISVMA